MCWETVGCSLCFPGLPIKYKKSSSPFNLKDSRAEMGLTEIGVEF